MTQKISILVLTLLCFNSFQAQADVDPRLKTMGTVALYGTTGGAILGLASLAFDGGGRNIAKGASLGLYAGIIFGGYVMLSYYQKSQQSSAAQYQGGSTSPYTETEVGAEDVEYRPNNLGVKYQFKQDRSKTQSLRVKDIPVYFNLLKFQF